MTSKPTPPSDLWTRLEIEIAGMKPYAAERPPNSFTVREFMDNFKMTKGVAGIRIRKLMETGKIKKYGSTGATVYYMFIDS